MIRLLFFSIVVVLFTFTSCFKGNLIEEYYFTEDMYDQIPYEGNEIVTFLDNESDNIVFIGGERINELHKETQCSNCDYYYTKTSRISFSNDSLSFAVSMEASSIYRFSIIFVFDKAPFACSFYRNLPLSNQNLSGSEIYLDSIVLNDQSYYNIFGDTLLTSKEETPIIFPVFCYYSTEYGVLKIDFSDNTSWELKSVEW